MMANWFGISNTAEPGQIPASVKLSFYIGGAAFFLAVSWTVLRSTEYSPEELAAFDADEDATATVSGPAHRAPEKYRNGGVIWAVVGLACWYIIAANDLEKQLYIIAGACIVFGALQVLSGSLGKAGKTNNGVYEVMHDLFHMPRVMKQLAVVQFFSWFALFAMWIYGTAAVTSHHYGTIDATSAAYNDGADWNGVLFAAYNGFAALAAIAIPYVADRLGCRICHLVNMTLGGIGLISFYFISNPVYLLIPMIGVGVAWASVLSLPYALLSNNLPSNKMGIYMGIFNFFIVIPQIVAASILGLLLREFFGLQSIFGLVIGGVLMIVAGFATMLVDQDAEPA